jgi:streptogramin lyase
MPITPALSAAKMRRNLGVTTVKLANNSVTLEKIEQIEGNKFLGRTGSGTGNPDQINQFLHMKVPTWTNGGHVTNFSLLSAYLDGVARSNKNIPSSNFTASLISTPGVGANIPIFQGAVLGPNGKIYFAPNYNTIWTLIDPATDTYSTFGQFTKIAATPAMQSGILHPNGRIYFIPEGGITTGVFVDPSNNSVTTFSDSGHLNFPSNTNYVDNSVLHPNGKIYVSAYTGAGGLNKVVVIEPNNNNNCYTFTSTFNRAYINLGPNGNIYALNNNILYRIDPSSETITPKTLAAFVSNIHNSWFMLAPNGFLYSSAADGGANSSLGYINPFDETVTTYAADPTLGTSQFTGGGVLAPNGKIYLTPYSYPNLVVIDPDTNTVTTHALPSSSNNGAAGFWLTAVLSPQGNIYFSNFGSTSTLKLSLNLNNNFNFNVLTNPFINRGF